MDWQTHIFRTTSGGSYMLRYSPVSSDMDILSLGAGTFGATVSYGSWLEVMRFLTL